MADASGRGSGPLLGGRYRLGAEIGRGGQAHVHEGIDTRLGRAVAIKVLHPEVAGDATARALFVREQEVLAAIDHPGVVRLVDADLDPTAGIPWAVHSLVRGRTLHDVVESAATTGTAVPAAWAVARVVDLLLVLEHVHSVGVVHGDLSAGNVMVTDDDRVVVLDVGCGRLGEVVTTPATLSYAAPERLSGGGLEPAGDVFSVGALLHHLLAGSPPFAHDSPRAVGRRVTAVVPSLHVARPGLPRRLAQLVLQALRADPSDRPPAPALRAALASLVPVLESVDVCSVATARRGSPVEATPPLVLSGRPAAARVPAPVTGAASVPTSAGTPQEERPPAPRRTSRAGRFVVGAAVAAGLALVGGIVLGGGEVAQPVPLPASGPTTGLSPSQALVPVPALMGLSLPEATARLVAAGLVVGATSEMDGAQRAGVVVSASPQTGAPVSAGSRVDLVTASGRSVVPDVVALSLAQARELLARAGFAVSWTVVPASVDEVLSSVPQAGTPTSHGSTIELLLGQAPIAGPEQSATAGPVTSSAPPSSIDSPTVTPTPTPTTTPTAPVSPPAIPTPEN